MRARVGRDDAFTARDRDLDTLLRSPRFIPRMDRTDWIELAVSIGAVLVMLTVMVVIGMTYGGAQGVLTADGGLVLAGAVMFFVFFMVAVGYGLAFFLKTDEDDDGNPA